MQHNQLISITIPVYNAEKYIDECIDSVVNQSYPFWELFLINDGSNDRSEELCYNWSTKDQRIRLITIDNKGASYARNIGIKESKGEFIFFMDADDCLTLNALETLFSLSKKYDADIIAGNALSFNEWKEFPPTTLHNDEIVSGKDFIDRVLTGKTIASIWGKLYRHTTIENTYFSEGLKLGEDVEFLTRLFLSNPELRVYCSSKVIYKYRMVKNSISHDNKNNTAKLKSYIDALIAIYEQYRDIIRRACGYSFAKNLIGSIFLYLRLQPPFNKHLPSGYKDIVADLIGFIDPKNKPEFVRKASIIINRSMLKVTSTFFIDAVGEKCHNLANKLIRFVTR